MALAKRTNGQAGAASPNPVNITAQQVGQKVSFLKRDIYVSGGGLPIGDYCMFFTGKLDDGKDPKTGVKRGDERLGILLTAYQLADPTAAPLTQFYSLGKSAHKSFMWDTTGKCLNPISGAPPANLFKGTNWQIFLEEMVNAGMPDPWGDNDLSVLDGLWAHTQLIPEPEERKTMGAQSGTGEAAMAGQTQRNRKPGEGTISVISQFHEPHTPWGGQPGMPTGPVDVQALMAGSVVIKPPLPPARPLAPAPPVQPARQVAVQPPHVPAPPQPPQHQPAPPPAIAGNVSMEDLMGAYEEALTSVFSDPVNAAGTPRVTARMATAAYIEKQYGEDVVPSVLDSVFDVPANLGIVLGKIGYAQKGLRIEPVVA